MVVLLLWILNLHTNPVLLPSWPMYLWRQVLKMMSNVFTLLGFIVFHQITFQSLYCRWVDEQRELHLRSFRVMTSVETMSCKKDNMVTWSAFYWKIGFITPSVSLLLTLESLARQQHLQRTSHVSWKLIEYIYSNYHDYMYFVIIPSVWCSLCWERSTRYTSAQGCKRTYWYIIERFKDLLVNGHMARAVTVVKISNVVILHWCCTEDWSVMNLSIQLIHNHCARMFII